MRKPKIKYIRGQYQCARWNAKEYIGFGKTPQEAYNLWYSKNEAPDTFHLAA